MRGAQLAHARGDPREPGGLALRLEHVGDASRDVAPGTSDARDLAALIRGVRFVFLAVAAASAAGGWLLGSALPIITALLIAGVDVIETGFLLIVVSLRGEQSRN